MEDFLYKFLSIYNHLPLPVKQIIGKLYNLVPASVKYGPFYNAYINRLRLFHRLNSLNDNCFEQNKLLCTQVNKAIEQVPYYRNYTKINNIEDFRNLPIIDKKIINESHASFINPKLQNKGIQTNTGGSSGTPMEFYIERGISRPKEKAHFDWYWNQFGYKTNDKILMVRGLPLNKGMLSEYRTIDNVLNVSCYSINEKNITEILEVVNKFRPKFIHAYPSSLKIITSLLEKHKDKLQIEIKALFLGSEYLSEHDRALFEGFYHAKVINWYGHSERLIHGGNCPFSNEYHFFQAYGYMELLDEQDKVITVPGKMGRIVATGFDNQVMPFIRYDTGDIGELSENASCICGFQGPSLKRIVGRNQDFIILSDKTKVSLTAFIFGQHLKAFSKIREMQIIQHEIGKIELRIVKNADYTKEDEEDTRSTLINSVNNKIVIDFSYIETVPKTSRGKNIFFISNI